jgi:L-rhamnose-H+ transport protein
MMASQMTCPKRLLGIADVIVSGILNGTFLYPMRLLKGWKWEHAWLTFCLLGLLLFPGAIALFTVPSLSEVYRMCSLSTTMLALVLGLGFGGGSLFFGLGVAALGLSLGNAIVMGTMAVIGTLIPALVLEPGMFATTRGFLVVGSLVLIVLGLILSSLAGRMRDQLASTGSGDPSFRILVSTGFRRGLVLCLLSGLLSASFNIGFALTTAISKAAEKLGASPAASNFAIWALVMGAGSIPNLLYCWHLIHKDRSSSRLRSGFGNWFYVAIMSCLWVLSVKLYGDGAIRIGIGGATIAWPILVASTVIGATALGILTAEWRGTSRRVRTFLYAGLSVFLAAIVIAAFTGVG